MNSDLLRVQQLAFKEYQIRAFIEGKKKLKKLWGMVKQVIRVKLKAARRAIGFFHPTAEIVALHFHSINLDKANIVVHLRVKNPNLFSVNLLDSEVILETVHEGVKLAKFKVDHAQTIELKSLENVDIPLEVDYRDVAMSCPGVRPGIVIPFTFRVDVSFREPLVPRLHRFSLQRNGDLPVPAQPEILIQKIAFEHLSFARSDAKVRLRIFNRNDFKLSMLGLHFTIALEGIRLVTTTVGESVVIRGYDFHVVDAPISFHPREFGRAMWHAIGGQRAAYELFGTLEAETAFGTLHLPFITQGLDAKLERISPYEPE